MLTHKYAHTHTHTRAGVSRDLDRACGNPLVAKLKEEKDQLKHIKTGKKAKSKEEVSPHHIFRAPFKYMTLLAAVTGIDVAG
jgi:hypothetical protein